MDDGVRITHEDLPPADGEPAIQMVRTEVTSYDCGDHFHTKITIGNHSKVVTFTTIEACQSFHQSAHRLVQEMLTNAGWDELEHRHESGPEQ